MRGRASGKRSIDSAAMGGEQKPVHHRLGRGGKKPIVIIGTVVVFFVVLSMTGLGHSHNHVERDMPAHAALSGRGARRHRPEADHFARARAGGGLHGAHGLRDRYRAHDSATHRVGSGDRHERAHDASFGHAIDDAIETTAKTWMHEVVDPIVDTLHDSAQHGGRGGAGARHHGRGADDASFSETSLLAGAERAAEAAGGLAHLTHAARDAAHLDRDTDGLLNDVSESESSFSRFGDADDPAAKLAELKSGLNPARGARDGAFDPRLVWHPPPRGDRTISHDPSHRHDSTSMHSAGVVAGDRDASRAGRARDDERREDEDENVLTSVDAFDDEDAFRDDDDGDAFRADTRTVDRSTAATSGVLLSCERCSHHGTCALGGDCQCAAMFEGKACRITRALARPDPAETKHTASRLDPVLSGFARGFGGSMTLTRENAPAKLEAHPLASGAAAHNAAIAADERLEVEDDWTRDENDENDARTKRARVYDDGRIADSDDASLTSDPLPAPAKFGKITRSTRERLPERGPFDESVLSRCALVGRGSLHASARPADALGFEVDAHDAVFRFGDDPVVGYENVVGSRTTFRFVVDDSDTNPRSQYLGEAQPRDEKKTKTSKPVTRPGSTVAGDEGFVKREEDGVSVSSVSRKEKDGPTKTVRFVRDSVSFKRYLAARLAKPELEIHVAHPNFLAWVDGAVRGSAKGSPSPELYGALVAAHKCREVNLYGFQTRAGAADAAERAGEIARESDESDARDDGERVFDALERNLGTASDSGLGAAATPSLDPLEWAVLTRMARSGVLHFAEPCVVECAESAAACDACEADPESSRIARAAVGRARAAGNADADGAVDDSEKSIGASLDHWMSGVAGTFAHSGFERAEHERKGGSDGVSTASVASAVFARGVSARLDDDTEAYATDRFGGAAAADRSDLP